MNTSGHAQYDLDPERLRHMLPDAPGVYCFKDHAGRMIYVGKAKNLKKRVGSYVRAQEGQSHKTALMMQKAEGVDVVVTATEKEAFILESSLIKKNLPRYNVILRDDKQYPLLRLDVHEDYPRLSVVRKLKKDNALYFGPFSDAGAARSTLRTIDRIFKLRKCKGSALPKRERPCLNFQMGRCLAPCTHAVPVSEYRKVVNQARLFLEGRNTELLSRLKKEMTDASEKLDFERAAAIRDQIRACEKTVERQHVVSHRLEDQDVIGLAPDREGCQIVTLFIRKGYMVGSRHFMIKDRMDSRSEVMEAFIKQYYFRETFIPAQILISEPIQDIGPIMDWLGDSAGKKVMIRSPRKGEKLRLVHMAVSNAAAIVAARSRAPDQEDLAALVQNRLHLQSTPRCIEGLDISNIHGDAAVGTIVRFVDGIPHKDGYRNFRIKATKGINDYGMMAELAERRIAQGDLPDLFLVDGGKGHLAVVKDVVDRFIPDAPVPVAAIAKPDGEKHEKQDKLFVPGRKNPLSLRPDHPVLFLMMQIRDEAHRRAIDYHRRLRKKTVSGSKLDQIRGIGKAKRNHLLKRFGDISAISRAGMDELREVPGIHTALARDIIAFLNKRIR